MIDQKSILYLVLLASFLTGCGSDTGVTDTNTINSQLNWDSENWDAANWQ